ncbi:CidA/LrgA family protein [Chitinolyticbacter meiyuanensis]|uniref:CidA/LrgA family protein n=1 Tax=Chitinolyticbacter meiyuanensis TaxID=682798 RepID=UPI0011E5901B|nr:CidA/LrgA family protein [Chitinolyticbacter meiyuanensis]
MLYGLTVLFAFLLAGEMIVRTAGLPIPGSVLAMLLLTAWLLLRRGVEPRVAKVSSGLMRYMPLFFVPAGVGVMDLGPQLASEGWSMLAVIVLSTLITLAVTALTLQWLLRRQR